MKPIRSNNIAAAELETGVLCKLRHPKLMLYSLSELPLIVTWYEGDKAEKPLTVQKAIHQSMFAGLDSFWIITCAQL